MRGRLAIAGPPTIRAPRAGQTSLAVPSASNLQMRSVSPSEETYTREFAANAGARACAVGSGILVASEACAGLAETGTRQSDVLDCVAAVATRRRPSALAASEMYRSTPWLIRCGTRRAMSRP